MERMTNHDDKASQPVFFCFLGVNPKQILPVSKHQMEHMMEPYRERLFFLVGSLPGCGADVEVGEDLAR
jgi:hypothetical protein